jgi:hypothetical protein
MDYRAPRKALNRRNQYNKVSRPQLLNPTIALNWDHDKRYGTGMKPYELFHDRTAMFRSLNY